jgi:NAD(P)-dependent dehydrogenase (short-subunit alcohol dehydrogenase family)
MTQKSLLITGCSTGIGLAAAETMKSRGWRVFASCRLQEDCDRLIAMGFESPRIDYLDAESIRTGLEEVLTATGGTLDALFNNGARALPAAVEDLPTAALREMMETNLIGWHDLTCQVLPVMRKQGYGRIVQNSSVLGYVSMPYRGAYVATKFALEGLSAGLRIELRNTPIHVILIEPGPITSNIRTNAAKQFFKWIDWENSPHTADYRTGLVERLTEEEQTPDKFELPASAVCDKLSHALEAARPRPRYRITFPARLMYVLRRILPTRALDWVISKG